MTTSMDELNAALVETGQKLTTYDPAALVAYWRRVFLVKWSKAYKDF